MTTPRIDLALVGGRVRTLDPAQPSATAVAISGGTIAAVGSDEEIRALAGSGSAEIIDLDGAAVTPGIIDSHLHPFMGARQARGADLMDARTIEDVRRLVAQERARCAPHEWVMGFGLDYNVFEESGIHASLIDDAVDGAPALLMFIDMHVGLVSSKTLEVAGITGKETFPEHAEVVVGADGRPTGELREWGALDLAKDALPKLTEEATYRLYADQLKKFAAAGITGAHGMDGDLTTPVLLRQLEERGDLVTRLVMPFWVTPDTPEETWEAYAAARDEAGSRWRMGVAKFFIDGVIDAGTGWLCEADSEGEGLSAFWPDPAKYRRAVKFFSERGFQCVTHATGDRGVREALDAYRESGPPAGRPGIQHRIEHIETLQPSDYPRFAAEGVTASMQAQHMMWLAPDRSDNWSRRLAGHGRTDRAFPTRSLWESGAHVTLGSDWPVARFDPREGMAAARLRRPPGETARGAYDDQTLTGLQALEGYTSRAARTVGDHDRLGQVKAGFAADLTVWADDPADTDADALLQLDVVMTLVDGEIVHRS